MSSQEVLFHCSCTAAFCATRPPPSDPPLALFQHHALSTLLFCEECDAIRCDACASNEVACYYCPNCLFEVPSASVRGEKNRYGPPLLTVLDRGALIQQVDTRVQVREELLPVSSVRPHALGRRVGPRPFPRAAFGRGERRRTPVLPRVQRVRLGFETSRDHV